MGSTPEHTVEITVTDLTGGHTFAFLSYAYLPSFDKFADMPTLTLSEPVRLDHKKIIGIATGIIIALVLVAIFGTFLL